MSANSKKVKTKNIIEDIMSSTKTVEEIKREMARRFKEYEALYERKVGSINKKSNVKVVKRFPNSLLLEESVLSESQDDVKEEKQAETNLQNAPDTKDKIDNIWDFVEQINKEADDEDTETPDKEDDEICKECGEKNSIIEDNTGCMVCSECGTINEQAIDHSPEWRQYNNDDSRGEGINRCAGPTNYFFPKSSQGTIMTGSSFSRLKRKQKWNSMVYKERSLNKVLEYIADVCSKNNIQKIITDTAKIMYKKLNDCKHKDGPNKGKSIIIRGENRNSIIAACLFFACVMNETPRNIKEVAHMFNLDEKRVTRGCKQLYKLMKNCDDTHFFDQLDSSTPEHYIRRYCPKMKLSKESTDLAVQIARNCCKLKIASDHNPHSIAAGSIMLMVNYKNIDIDKKQIASLFKTSEVTITKIYNKISPFDVALVDDDATDHLMKKFKINI